MANYIKIVEDAGKMVVGSNSYYHALRILVLAAYTYQADLKANGVKVSDHKAAYAVVSDFFNSNRQKFTERANRDTVYKYEKRFEKSVEWCLECLRNQSNETISVILIDQIFRKLENFSPNLSAISKSISAYYGKQKSNHVYSTEDNILDEFVEIKINILELNEILSLARHGDIKSLNTIQLLKIHLNSTKILLNEWLPD